MKVQKLLLRKLLLYAINTAHRALEEVKAINEVFQNDGFPMVLQHLIQTIAQIFSDWETKRFN